MALLPAGGNQPPQPRDSGFTKIIACGGHRSKTLLLDQRGYHRQQMAGNEITQLDADNSI